MTTPALPPRSVLILVQNLPVPLDRRVWLEAQTLAQAGYRVSVICPTGRGWDLPFEVIEGIHIWRYPAPPEAHAGALAYGREWAAALWHMARLSRIVRRDRGFQVIQACNPPDLLFLVALIWRPFGVRFLFDHHDVCPELFQAKFGRRGPLYLAMRALERLTFAAARVSIATNDSFRRIALTRGGMAAEDVFTVRSAPRIDQFRPGPGNRALRRGAATVLGYVGVIGQQEGMDLLVAAVDHLVRAGEARLADVHVLIVGFGPHLDTVRADVAARGLEDRFTFTGPLYGAALLDALNAIDIGLSPDPKNPMNDICTMNKIMEYMTLEKPVVLFDLAEGRASAGEAALYARANDPADFAAQIAALIRDPGRARAMGRAGRARVLDRLSWDHSAPQLLAAWDRVFAWREGRVPRRRRRRQVPGPAA